MEASFTPQHRPAIWGVVNVTPDSFSDGGLYAGLAAAVARGKQLTAAGADFIDVGGESTRPGAQRTPVEVECERVVPVVSELAGAGVRVSIDTSRAVVAQRAVAAGACIVNDVSGGLGDPHMLETVASLDAHYVAMHWRAPSTHMDAHATYSEVIDEVCSELSARIDAALAAGIDHMRLIADPGFGFAKDARHNLELLRALPQFVATFTERGVRTLVGTSRKRFLGAVIAAECGEATLSAAERDLATAATSLLAAQAGAWAVRVHEVTPTAHMFAVHAAVSRLCEENT